MLLAISFSAASILLNYCLLTTILLKVELAKLASFIAEPQYFKPFKRGDCKYYGIAEGIL